MAYIPPDQVISPKDHWELNCVVYDEGEGGTAVAWGSWYGSECLAIRWYGTSEPHKGLGNPQSSGHATWFILPSELGVVILRTLIVQQAAGNNCLRQQCLNEVIIWLKRIKAVKQGLRR
jgi:hypothetical protein